MNGSRSTRTPLPRPIGDVQSGTVTHPDGQWIEMTFGFGIHWTFIVTVG